MSLLRLCFVVALASTLSFAPAACNGGGDSGVPITPDIPDSSVPDSGVPGSVDGGSQMPEPSESAEPPPGGMSGPIMPEPQVTPMVATSPSVTPAPAASPTSLFVPPHSNQTSKGLGPGVKPAAAVPFTLSSTTFKNKRIVPLTMVYKGNGCKGGDMSPELQWAGVPKKTKSFAILVLDTTAIFWHWGMYNVAGTATSLPQNAGTSSSKYGKEVLNDWSIYFGTKNRGYGGPCPPPGLTHHYVFTLYALDTTLTLSRSAHVENLDLAIRGHILGSASITGLYKT